MCDVCNVWCLCVYVCAVCGVSVWMCVMCVGCVGWVGGWGGGVGGCMGWEAVCVRVGGDGRGSLGYVPGGAI